MKKKEKLINNYLTRRIETTLDRYNLYGVDIPFSNISNLGDDIISFGDKGSSFFAFNRTSKDEIVLLSELKKDELFKLHKHSDFNELLEVESGKIIEAVSGNILSAGDKVYIPAGVRHEIRVLEDTTLYTTCSKII